MVVNLLPSTTFRAHNNQIGAFIQDDWTVNEHLTYNLGIRWDYESNMLNNKFVTPAGIVTALANYPNWVAAGIDYHDYVSTGHNRKADTGEFAPRLGVTYDVNGDRDLVFFAGWGRYYDRDVFLSGQIESVQDTVEQIATIRTLGLGCTVASSTCIAWDPSYKDPNALRAALSGQTGGAVWLLNNKTKTPFSDNLDFGFRKRVGDATWSVSYQHNMSYNVFQYVRGNRLPDGSYTSQGPGWTEDNFRPKASCPAIRAS